MKRIPRELAVTAADDPCNPVDALLHFDQKSDGRHVRFSTLPCRMYDTLVFFEASETCRPLSDT